METAPGRSAPSGEMGDDELVRRVCAGELPLFEVLMRRSNARLYRALRSLVSDENEVEELMQQTYVLAYSKLSQFAHGSRFSTWLIRIGINEALQRMRKQRRLRVMDERSPPSPEEQADARQAVRWVERIVARMPDLYRVVFVLREVEGLSTSETAGSLGITEDAVKQRLFRARQLLREGREAQSGQTLQEIFPFHASRCDRLVRAVLEHIAQPGRG